MSGSWTRIGQLAAVTGGLWLVAALPAWLLADARGLEGLTYALLLCLLPGIAVLGFVKPEGGPNQALTALLLGMGLRMAVVLAGTLLLKEIRPDLGPSAFLVWVVVGYLATLTFETRTILAGASVARPGSGVGQSAS
jgi:hypothetical protein